MTAPSRLVEIADELYGLVPGEFIGARDAAVRAARTNGDRELADQLKSLRKPSVGAWLADKLVRDEPTELDELLALGQAMREARDALDGAKLRSMSRERHAIVRSLIERATVLAAQDDQRAGDPAQRELEVTLDAVLADEQAAKALRTGRLVRGLTATGLEPVDMTDAVAVPEAAPPARRGKARRRPAPEPEPKTSPARTATKQHAKQQAARDRAVADAQATVDDAEADRAQREDELRSAQDALDAARERVTGLERELRAATTERARAETACHEADAAHRAATRKRDTARRTLDAAQRRASD